MLYFFPYFVICLTAMGLFFGGAFSFFGFFFVFIIHPLIEYFFPLEIKHQWKPRFIVSQMALLPIFPSLLGLFLFCLFRLNQWTLLEIVGATLSFGSILGAIGITAAHELVHRRKSIEKLLGYGILLLSFLPHWGIEHVYGHHKNVATPLDAASAHQNESLYSFWFRNYVDGLKHSFLLKKQFIILIYLINLTLFFMVFLWFGAAGLFFSILSAKLGVILLFSVEYIEHYGLVRKENSPGLFERVESQHSWDSYHLLTNITLFNLGIHAHHHNKANLTYNHLEKQNHAHLMPYGYSVMIWIALFPNLFFKVMNPRIKTEGRKVK